ncbi:VanZ family protein [Aequorivita marisscotiae]|uniref:VanZ family protein n=1 Tax=Aequorivita marisscotiae TaxID=3040348 RepID=A0ABY8L020_9FLAO|nr:VanZ family protein [Aequorivita sp. Ant34-E75]WGF93805.1 VanZ family protein [Aequorivita sp. Ant34-E75]
MPLIKNLLAVKTLLFIALLYSIVITSLFFLSSQNLPKTQISEADKLVHILIHFILVNLWLLYFFVKNKFHFKKNWILIVVLSVLFYGIIIEIFQELFTDSRSADILDVAANLTGAILGIFFFKNLKHKLKPKYFN